MQLLWNVVNQAIDEHDAANVRELLDRMIALSPRPDDDVYVLVARGWQGILESNFAAVREATRRSLELGAGRAPEHALDVAYLLMYVADDDEVRDVLDSLIERVRREGSFFDLAQALNAHASIERRRGHLASAEAEASEALALAVAAGLLYSECHSLSYLAGIEAMLGKHEECEKHAQRALDLSPRVHAGVQQSARALHALGISALVRGRVTPAIEALERCRNFMSRSSAFFWQADLIDAYIRAGRIDDARELTLTLEREASSRAHDFALMQAARCRAALADAADADAAFDEATRLCDIARWPFERARCDLANGERLRRGGQRAAARVQLRSAIEIFDRIGAAGFAERARQELAATGETLRTRADDEPEQLTAQELQTALLVARGATNREAAASLFLSPKTVGKTPLQRLSQTGRALAQRTGTTALRPVGKSLIRGRPRLPQVSGLPRRDAPPARRSMGETNRHVPDLRGGGRNALPVLHDARPPAPT